MLSELDAAGMKTHITKERHHNSSQCVLFNNSEDFCTLLLNCDVHLPGVGQVVEDSYSSLNANNRISVEKYNGNAVTHSEK